MTRDRFLAMTSDAAQQAPLRDLVVAVFELLEHTPTTRLGLNRWMHYRMPSEESWHTLGRLIAPKSAWEGVLSKPGMLSVSVQGEREDSIPGRLVMKVEPSIKYQPRGAFIDVNNDVFAPATGDATSYFVSILRDHWDRLIRDAGARATRLISKATGESE